MSTEIVDIIRAIVRDEMKSVRLGDIGVVTSVFPHTQDGDTNNHECSVRLREGQLELRRVPIATAHVGMVSAPKAGELVLVAYVGGDPNRPIVVGRLYSDEHRPPLHTDTEWRVDAPYGGETSLSVGKDASVSLAAGKTTVKIGKDGDVVIAGKGDLKIEVKGNAVVKCADCTLDATGDVQIGTGGAGVITEASHKCYFTGAPLVGSKTVKVKG